MVVVGLRDALGPREAYDVRAAGASSDGTEPNWDATKLNRISAHRIRFPATPSWTSGLSRAGGSSHALRFDVFYEADPPEVDYQPRVGRWWTTDALAVDDPSVAIQIEVIVAAPAGSPGGDLCDRIVVTFDGTNSTEIEIRGKVVGKPVTEAKPGPPASPQELQPEMLLEAKPAISPESTPRRPSPRHRTEPTFGLRIAMSFHLAGLRALVCCPRVALTFGYTIPTSELPNILWLQSLAIPVCAFFLAVAVFAILPWSIVHAVRQRRPKS